MYKLENIREILAHKLFDNETVTDKNGGQVVEIIGTSFVIPEEYSDNEKVIFGEPNFDYIERELEWYKSQSLYVKDIPGKVPAIWEAVADNEGKINSNYGYLIWSFDNWHQYANVLAELERNPQSRRAIMIYTRPSMHLDYNRNGMSDFICTNTVQYFIRDNKLSAVVNMRSNDAIFGFRNDYHWQRYVLGKLLEDLKKVDSDLEMGDIIWQTGSLHVYDRHFYLIDHYRETGELSISKEEYRQIYPNSTYV